MAWSPNGSSFSLTHYLHLQVYRLVTHKRGKYQKAAICYIQLKKFKTWSQMTYLIFVLSEISLVLFYEIGE